MDVFYIPEKGCAVRNFEMHPVMFANNLPRLLNKYLLKWTGYFNKPTVEDKIQPLPSYIHLLEVQDGDCAIQYT
jgi:hypothetical protein